jgi:PAS domain S-box-containing protein
MNPNPLDQVLQRVSDGIVAVDASWCCTYLNPKASELLGKSPQALVGQNIWDVFPEAIASESYAVLHQAMAEQRLIEFEYYFAPWERWFTHRIYPDPTGLTIYFADVTDRKRIEAEIRSMNAELEQRVNERTMALAATNEGLEAFSYSVSHDLRAPLRGIVGFAQILERDLGDGISPAAKESLMLIQSQGQQMRQMIDALLNFSRLGQQPLQKQTVRPNDLIAQAIAELQVEPTDRRITYTIADLQTCEADPILLKQVWFNLIDNAIKYTQQQPDAQIAISRHTPADPTQPAIYQIRDNGIGFDMRTADRLFGVFQRLHPPSEFAGTGIGLALVQRIIQRHGGHIWAESSPNQGTTFYFTLTDV